MNRASIFLDSSSIITIPEHLQDADSKTVRIESGAQEDYGNRDKDAIHVESAAQARELAAALLKAAHALDGNVLTASMDCAVCGSSVNKVIA